MGGGNHPPYTKGHRDPNDEAVDAVGRDLQPLPIRNGKGADIQGPRNPDRERQQPDMIRPPSTDRGTMPNLKWSFADSHTRIEVSVALVVLGEKPAPNFVTEGRMGEADYSPRASDERPVGGSEHATRRRGRS